MDFVLRLNPIISFKIIVTVHFEPFVYKNYRLK